MPSGALLLEDTDPEWGCEAVVGRGSSTEWEPKFSSEGIPECANPAPPAKAAVNEDIAQPGDPYCKFLISSLITSWGHHALRARAPHHTEAPLKHVIARHRVKKRDHECKEISLWFCSQRGMLKSLPLCALLYIKCSGNDCVQVRNFRTSCGLVLLLRRVPLEFFTVFIYIWAELPEQQTCLHVSNMQI